MNRNKIKYFKKTYNYFTALRNFLIDSIRNNINLDSISSLVGIFSYCLFETEKNFQQSISERKN